MTTPTTAHAEGPSSHPQAATLEFRNVSKTYEGSGEPAIQDLSFEVPAGEICVLVGPSGCGKTTAMRLVNRMIEMTSGDILVGGVSVRTRRPADLRREIGYAIQQIGLFPHQTIAENIATVPRVLGWPRERIRARVDELIELIGLDPGRDARPLPRAALRRPAPARRRGARPGRRPAADAHGRAVRRHRPDQPRAPAERAAAPAGAHPQDDRLRHPRHRRGDQARRPHRGAQEGRRAGPVRDAGGAADGARRRRSSRTSSAPTARSSAWPSRARARSTCGRSTTACPSRSSATRRGRPVAWERGGERHPVRTVRSDESLRDALSDLLRSPVQLGAVVDDEGRVQGVLGLDVIHELLEREERGRERPDDPRPGRRRLLPRPLAERRQLRGQQRLLPGLDRPPPRPLRVALLAAPVPGRGVGRPRLRDRLRARARRAPPAPARRPDHPGHGDPLHDPQPRLLLPAAADHRARQHDGAHRADRLHAAHPLSQHRRRPRRRARGGARRRPRHGPDRPPAAVARRAAAGAAGDHGRPADRGDDDRRARGAGHLRGRRRASATRWPPRRSSSRTSRSAARCAC